jgi:protein TonB
VGAIAILVVGVGIAGALFLRSGAAVPAADPAASVAEPPPPQLPEPAGAVAIPEATPAAAPPATAPAPPAAGTAAGRGASGAAAKTPGAAQSRPGTKPLPTQPALATQGPGAAVVPAPVAPAAPPPPASSSRIYQTVEVDVRPEVVAQVRPVYPEEAAKQNVQDVVVLQVLVDVAGRPESIKVLRGSRRAPALDEAATAAVRQWTFRPAKKNGQPVPCWFNVGVPFPPKAP